MLIDDRIKCLPQSRGVRESNWERGRWMDYSLRIPDTGERTRDAANWCTSDRRRGGLSPLCNQWVEEPPRVECRIVRGQCTAVKTLTRARLSRVDPPDGSKSHEHASRRCKIGAAVYRRPSRRRSPIRGSIVVTQTTQFPTPTVDLLS